MAEENRLDKNPIQVAVIILTHNQRDRTIKCLTSLASANASDLHILLWDNGSSDGTTNAAKEAFPDVLVHANPSNLGVASGRNAAAELAIKTFDPTYLLFLDNDMLVEPGFVDALSAPFTKGTKIGQTQAKLRFMDDRQRLNDGGGARINFMFWKIKPVGYGEVDHGQYDTPGPCVACGGAMMVRADIFRQLGGFDAAFDPFGPEDLDFSLRLQKAGYCALYVPGAIAYHQVSHTYGKGYTEDYVRHKLHHWLLFMHRHASLMQKSGFYFFGAPFLAVHTLIREAGRGNIKALRGIIRGMIDFKKS